MTSIAELGIRVDSTDAAQAGTDLDKLAAAGGRAEKAADRASASFRKQTDDLAGLLGEIDPTVKALGRLDELESRLAKQKKLGALDASTFSEYQSKIEQSRTNLARFDDSLTRTGNTAKQTANAMRGVPAHISSRITTVIRVVVTIKQTITDLMSHSQFHSLNSFILTHAWLNL